MFNMIKKVPIVEIVTILLLNIIIFIIGTFQLFLLFLEFDGYVSQERYNELVFLLRCNIFVISCYVCVYLNLFHLSVNRFFINSVYYFMHRRIILKVVCAALLVLSPAFWLSFGTGDYLGIISGIVLTFGFPLIVLFMNKAFLDWVRKYSVLISGWLYFIMITLLLLLLLIYPGNLYYYLLYFDQTKFSTVEIVILAFVMLITVPLLVTSGTRIIIEKVKKYILYLLPFWGVLLYFALYVQNNNLIKLYSVYISVLLLFVLLFSTPILKLKAKNLELRREVEEMYQNNS